MRHVLLVRHGQTEENAAGVLQGHLPTSLNDVGRVQARQLAARLRAHAPAIDALVSSDLPRARETAAPIAAGLGLEPLLDPAWRERAFGTFEGRAVGEIEIWRAASGAIEPPGAETIDAFRQRTLDALVSSSEAHRDRRCLVIVTHGGVIRSVLHLLHEGRLPLVAGHAAIDVVPIVNASILHLQAHVDHASGTRWRLHAVNDAAHLETPTPDFDAG